MQVLRAFLMRHRAIASMLVALALCLKAVVPAGYMVETGEHMLTVTICDAAAGHNVTKQIAIPMKDGGGKHGSGQDGTGQGKTDCAFSSLQGASVSGADPVLLLLAIAFLLTLGFAPVYSPVPRPFFSLRPPLRGPPLPA